MTASGCGTFGCWTGAHPAVLQGGQPDRALVDLRRLPDLQALGGDTWDAWECLHIDVSCGTLTIGWDVFAGGAYNG